MSVKGIERFLKTFASFVGPGYMVSIGYFDPGNWATDLAAGSEFGYKLLFVIFLANLMAMLLQSMCVRLGVVTGQDLAQGCRKYFPTWFAMILYVLCEIAIMATDLAEVIGSAIALNLLFNIPMAIGVCLTATDVMVILIFWEKKNLRVFEFVIICLVLITAGCLFTVTVKSQPVLRDVFLGYLPSSDILTNQRAVFISVGIIGATVMPHNLYLHSSIVKHRAAFGANSLGEIAEIDIADNVTSTSDSQPLRRKKILPDTIKFTNIDSIVALAFALLINSSILIISSANFHNTGQTNITEIEDAYHLIGKVLGQGFAILFATGLLIAGQASTVTGTMAGQIVMEGFLGDKFKVKPWIRRLVTRLLAVIPALICILAYGEGSLNNLLIMSQVILSLQLPFAVWPLIYFTSSKRIMVVKYEGEVTSEVGTIADPEAQREKVNEQCFANSNLVTILACIVGSLVTIFNIVLLTQVALGTS